MMDIKRVLLQWFINFLTKNFWPWYLRIFQTKNFLKYDTNQLLENSRKEKCNRLL